MVDYSPLKRSPGTSKPHDRVVRTVCQECTAGCGLLAYLDAGDIVDIQGDEDHPVSRGRLCAKGIAFPQGLNHPDRIRCVCSQNPSKEAPPHSDDWDKTLDLVAEKLRKLKARYGPRSLMIGCDPDAGLDFFVGAVRFGRLWGTPHVYHPLFAPGGIGSPAGHLSGSVPHCIDWARSRAILLVEADLATTHPVAFGWLIEAQNQGADVFALDSRFTPTLSKAGVAIQIKPESGNKVGLALAKTLLEENLIDQTAASLLFSDHQGWMQAFESLPYDGFEESTGLSVEQVQSLARRLASRSPVTIITGSRVAHRQNSPIWHTLALAAGWGGHEGGGWYPLDAGLPPFHLFADIDAAGAARADTEEDARFGSDIEAASEVGDDPEKPVKAFICSGNCLNDFMVPLQCLAQTAELNVAFGAFPNETTCLSHVVFPALLWPEKDNLSFSNDRAIQWGPKVLDPPAGCRSGLEFWMSLAQRMADVRHLEWGAYFPWKNEEGAADHRAFYEWLLDQSPYTSSSDIDALATKGPGAIHWPVQSTSSTASADTASSNGKFEPLLPPSSFQTALLTGDFECYPLALQATRVVSRSGDASRNWAWTNSLEDPLLVQIHPETAAALQIANGEDVLVAGPGMEIEARACLSRMVPKWMIWSPRKLGTPRALIHRKNQPCEEAAKILGELLQ